MPIVISPNHLSATFGIPMNDIKIIRYFTKQSHIGWKDATIQIWIYLPHNGKIRQQEYDKYKYISSRLVSGVY